MEVIVYFSKQEDSANGIHCSEEKEGQQELQKAVAIAHADLVASLVTSLSCSAEQKLELIKSISEECHKRT